MKPVYIPLPNGPKEQTPKRIIVHAMGEYIDTDPHDYHAVEFLRKIGLSAHAFVTPSGLIIRSRLDNEGAWHAKYHNVNTLGIEFLVPGLHNYGSFVETIKSPYLTEVQYQAGLWQVRDWVKNYEIEGIYRHSDVDPKRKVDPGDGFDFDRFKQDI